MSVLSMVYMAFCSLPQFIASCFQACHLLASFSCSEVKKGNINIGLWHRGVTGKRLSAKKHSAKELVCTHCICNNVSGSKNCTYKIIELCFKDY